MTGAPSRVVLKLSGEALQGAADKADKADNNNSGVLSANVLLYLVKEIAADKNGPRVAKVARVVVGGLRIMRLRRMGISYLLLRLRHRRHRLCCGRGDFWRRICAGL